MSGKTLMVSVSGVRGIVGEALTPDVVLKYASAFGEYLRKRKESKKGSKSGVLGVVVGRDSRTSGEMLENLVTAGLAAAGCEVIQIGIVPTPTVQVMVEELQACGGIAITASHNPREWNALKFISGKGTFLSGTEWQDFKAVIENPKRAWATWEGIGKVRKDPTAVSKHLSRIFKTSYIDKRRVARKGFRVAVDCVHGAGGNAVLKLLEELGCRIIAMGCEPDGLFPRNPEPLAENLSELCKLVKENGCDVGFACDPDADRLAIVDEEGRAIGEEYSLALSAQFVLLRKKGKIVTNLSTSRMIDDVAKQSGVELIRTSVGEANVVEGIVKERAIIGGEGNGGVILPEVHLGRDALVGIGLILAALTETGRKVSQLVERLPRYHMIKEKVKGRVGRELLEKLKQHFQGGFAEERDGLKLSWEDAWLQVRGSGTEPVIRVIAEAREMVRAKELVNEAKRLLRSLKVKHREH